MINSTMLVPNLRDQINTGLKNASLPVIFGTWYHVDPYTGSDSSDGSDLENALATVEAAYGKCTSGAGDGIVLYSRGTTTANTSSYYTKELLWTKHGITMVGIAAPTSIFSRARIASKTITTGNLTDLSFTNSGTADYISRVSGSFITDGFVVGQKIYVNTTSNTNDGVFTLTAVTATKLTLDTGDSITTESAVTAGSTVIVNYSVQAMTISGNNNTFYNIHIWNGGTYSAELGGVKITGARNFFSNCHFVGGAGCTATANERSLELGDGAQENVFEDCTIGTDTVDRGNNANCELLIAGTTTTTARNRFDLCTFLAQAEGGTAHLAIKSSAATSMGRHMIMVDPIFECYKSNLGTDQATVFGGTGFNTAKIFIVGKAAPCGYTAWDSNASNNCVFVNVPAAAASAGGGLMVTN